MSSRYPSHHRSAARPEARSRPGTRLGGHPCRAEVRPNREDRHPEDHSHRAQAADLAGRNLEDHSRRRVGRSLRPHREVGRREEHNLRRREERWADRSRVAVRQVAVRRVDRSRAGARRVDHSRAAARRVEGPNHREVHQVARRVEGNREEDPSHREEDRQVEGHREGLQEADHSRRLQEADRNRHHREVHQEAAPNHREDHHQVDSHHRPTRAPARSASARSP